MGSSGGRIRTVSCKAGGGNRAIGCRATGGWEVKPGDRLQSNRWVGEKGH